MEKKIINSFTSYNVAKSKQTKTQNIKKCLKNRALIWRVKIIETLIAIQFVTSFNSKLFSFLFVKTLSFCGFFSWKAEKFPLTMMTTKKIEKHEMKKKNNENYFNSDERGRKYSVNHIIIFVVFKMYENTQTNKKKPAFMMCTSIWK